MHTVGYSRYMFPAFKIFENKISSLVIYTGIKVATLQKNT